MVATGRWELCIKPARGANVTDAPDRAAYVRALILARCPELQRRRP
jgi:hypothetical protein